MITYTTTRKKKKSPSFITFGEYLILFFLHHDLYYDPKKLFITLIFINTPHFLYNPRSPNFVSMLISLLILLLISLSGCFTVTLNTIVPKSEFTIFPSHLSFLLKCFYCSNWPIIHSHWEITEIVQSFLITPFPLHPMFVDNSFKIYL